MWFLVIWYCVDPRDEYANIGSPQRNSFGDPGFVPNVTNLETTMLSQARIQRIYRNIDDNSVHGNVSFYDPDHKWTPESYV
jgi:gamma-glutamyltranspeptidase/glutathione hydrolase